MVIYFIRYLRVGFFISLSVGCTNHKNVISNMMESNQKSANKSTTKNLALLVNSGGAAPDLIYPSLQKLEHVLVVTFFIKSHANRALNDLYDRVIGTIGPGIECCNNEDMVHKAISYHEKEGIHGIMTLAEMLLEPSATICQHIGCAFMPISVVRNVQNKFKQRVILKNNKVPVPNFFEISSEKDLEIASKAIGFPSVLKPNYGGGSYFVYQINNYEELKEKYKQAQASFTNIIVENATNTFNLEEKIIGSNWHEDNRYGDYASVESLIVDGTIHHLSISDRTPLEPPFRETSLIAPTTLSKPYQDQLYEVTSQAIQALQLNHCATHTELKFTDQGPVVIEVNARAGGPVPFVLKLATDGYDLFYELAKLALGENVHTSLNFNKHSAIQLIHCPLGRWKIVKIERFEETKQLNGVEVAIQIGHDDKIVSSEDGSENLIALYYLTADTSQDLLLLMDKINKTLHVAYEAIR